MNKNNIFLVYGPSGSGKTLIVEEALKQINWLEKIKTCTTRKIRLGESENAYNFISEEMFEELKANNQFLETTNYDGCNYGTLISEIKETPLQKDIIMIVDINGVLKIKEIFSDKFNIFSIFIEPENIIERLKKRASLTGEDVSDRILKVSEEMQNKKLADIVLRNEEDKLDLCVKNFIKNISILRK